MMHTFVMPGVSISIAFCRPFVQHISWNRLTWRSRNSPQMTAHCTKSIFVNWHMPCNSIIYVDNTYRKYSPEKETTPQENTTSDMFLGEMQKPRHCTRPYNHVRLVLFDSLHFCCQNHDSISLRHQYVPRVSCMLIADQASTMRASSTSTECLRLY